MFPCVRSDGRLCHRFWFLSIVHLPHSSLCVLNTESPPWPLSAAVPLVARARRRAVRRSGDGSLLSENVVEVGQSRNASCDFREIHGLRSYTARHHWGPRRSTSIVVCVVCVEASAAVRRSAAAPRRARRRPRSAAVPAAVRDLSSECSPPCMFCL